MNREQNQEVLKVSKILFDHFKQTKKQQRLDPNKLAEFKQKYVKPLYPNKLNQEDKPIKYTCWQSFCQQSPGSFCCFSSSNPKKSFIKFGLGICLYFKFLKHSSIFYGFMTLLAVLSCIVCYAVAQQNNISTLQNYSNFLFSTTYGSFASEHNKCQYSLLTQNVINNVQVYAASFNLACPAGSVNYFSPVLSNQSLNSLYNCRSERQKQTNNEQSSITSGYILTNTSSCDSNNKECNLSIYFNPQVGNTYYTTVAYTYECLDNYYYIGNLYFKSQYYFYFVVVVDLFICFFFIVFLLSQIRAEQSEQTFFKNTQVNLSDFAIKISGFHRKTANKELRQFLKFLKVSNNSQNIVTSIVGYSFPESQKVLNIYQQMLSNCDEMSELLKKHYFVNEEFYHLEFAECHNRIFSGLSGDELFNIYRNKLLELINKFMRMINQKRMEYAQSNDKISLTLIFDQINKKQVLKKLLKKQCCSYKIDIQDNKYEVKDAPNPDMIIWQNKQSFTTLRVMIGWIITLIICLGSYLLFGFIQYEQSKLFSYYNYGIDCNVLYTSTQLGNINSPLLTQPNYVTCVCKSQSLSNIYSNDNSYCSTWQKQYVLYIAVPLLISLGIVIYNIVVSFIFKYITYFQRHKTLANRELSYTFKRSFMLIMNMGLIMILLNINYNSTLNNEDISFLFLGRYKDFTPDWYNNIGSIIILTMVFNILTPLFELILTCLLKGLRKCWDKRCCSVPTSKQTKKQFIQLYSDDIFPIGQRYAYLIATFMVSFAFSGVIPILTPIAAFSLVLLYFSDKILMFKMYQYPRNYTKIIHKTLIQIMFIAMIVHYGLSAYFLSQPNLVAPNSQTFNELNTYITNTRILNILTTSYIYPYLALLVILVVVMIISLLCSCIVDSLKSCCCSKVSFQSKYSIKKEINFWNILSERQAENLLQITEFISKQIQIEKIAKIKSLKKLSTQVLYTQNQVQIQQQILLNIIHTLTRKKQIQQEIMITDEQKVQLLGLPSYQYLIESQKLSSNRQMMKIQLSLRQFYLKTRYQTKINDNNNSASAIQREV